MNKKLVYFDNAATTPVHPKVVEKMLPYLNDHYGNPSSIHSYGRKVRVAIEEAREVIADSINAKPAEIYFVSGGTEANNFPVFGMAKTIFNEDGRNKILTSTADHHCVLESFDELKNNGFETELLKVDSDCIINAELLENSITDKTSLISVIHINNETGAENDLKRITEIAKANNIFVHSDAVQSYCKIKIDVNELPVDSLSFSAHKIGGPKGVGAVYFRTGTPVTPIIYGGSQERNRRGGTENAASIIGFAEAVKISSELMNDSFTKISSLRKYFINGIENLNNNIVINCKEISFPYILSLTFPPEFYKTDAEALLMYLDINGIAASNGAACTSGTLKPSHVILSMGKSKDYASGTIRISLGMQNTIEEIDYTLDVIEMMAKKFRL